MSYSAAERESVIRCDDETKRWSIYSHQTTVINKIRKNTGLEPYRVDPDGGHWFELNFGQVSFRREREVSEEQKLAASERAKKNFHGNKEDK